jgi:hypothetical protein
MTTGTDDLLAQELGKLGELSGRIGDDLLQAATGGKSKGSSGFAGSLGARFAAQFLPTESVTRTLNFDLSPDYLLRIGYSVLTKLGSIQSDTSETRLYPLLRAVIGSGFMNQNPTVVYFEILSSTKEKSTLTLTAAAKEGLIKQRSAEKALTRVVNAIEEAAKRD